MTPGWIAVGTLAVAFLGAVGVLIKLFPEIRQMRAQTHQSTVASVIAEDAAADARLNTIIEAQTHSLIDPLTKQVERQERRIEQQDTRIEALERRLESLAHLYRLALDTLKVHIQHGAILAGLLNDASIVYPSPPAVPAEIHDDM